MGETTVGIGEAAALYDIAPSALRWWEHQGLVSPQVGDDGRRRYGVTELRQVGLIHLCRTAGRMPLAAVAEMLSSRQTARDWHDALHTQVAELDAQVQQLAAARSYLQHLLECEHSDPAACPLLEDELRRHTPRGRVPVPELVSAARQAKRLSLTRRRDETPEIVGVARDGTSAPGSICAECGAPILQSRTGRPRRYCSHACQQRAYRRRAAEHGAARRPDRR